MIKFNIMGITYQHHVTLNTIVLRAHHFFSILTDNLSFSQNLNLSMRK